jgi:predicted MFS family arabinose efflux permease
VFRIPGIKPLYLASILGRLPVGALGLVLLLRTREMTGSYGAGGLVAAGYGLALGAGSPLQGRLIDRRGQRDVLIVSSLVSAGALAGFAALGDGTATAVAAMIAIVAGAALPPLNSCLRALLAAVIPAELRHRAFALDATMFELVYIAGPMLIVGVVGAWSLRAAALACAALTLTGTFAFAATRLSRERGAHSPGADVAGDLAGPLRTPAVRLLLIAMLLFGLYIAGLEVGLAAFAAEQGHRSAVGYLLALSGVGSMIGGLIAAWAPAPTDAARRLALLLAALAVLSVPMGLVATLPAQALAVAVGSLAISPALSLIFQLTSELAPAGTVTEAMTWLTSFISAGIAGGAALAGWLIDRADSTPVLLSMAVYGVIAAAVVASRSAVLATT